MVATSAKANTCARSMRSADAFLPPRAFGDFGFEDGNEDTRGEIAFVSETHEADGGAELMPVTVAQPGDACARARARVSKTTTRLQPCGRLACEGFSGVFDLLFPSCRHGQARAARGVAAASPLRLRRHATLGEASFIVGKSVCVCVSCASEAPRLEHVWMRWHVRCTVRANLELVGFAIAPVLKTAHPLHIELCMAAKRFVLSCFCALIRGWASVAREPREHDGAGAPIRPGPADLDDAYAAEHEREPWEWSREESRGREHTCAFLMKGPQEPGMAMKDPCVRICEAIPRQHIGGWVRWAQAR